MPNDLGVVSPRPFLLQPVAQPGILGRRGGDGERAPLHQARVDALGGADPGYLVHGVAELPLELADAALALRVPGVAGPGARQGARHPASVPARWAEPGAARLQHDDPDARLSRLE